MNREAADTYYGLLRRRGKLDTRTWPSLLRSRRDAPFPPFFGVMV